MLSTHSKCWLSTLIPFFIHFLVQTRSTAFNFNPKPAHPRILCHSLIELLSQVSPTFKKSFNTLQRRRWGKPVAGKAHIYRGHILMEPCLSSATQSTAASLRTDRNTFPGVYLDRPSRGAHAGLCPDWGDAALSHGPWGAHSWAGGKCGQYLWYFSNRENEQRTDPKITDLQVRDWNEELQSCRELAGNTIQERLHRERSIFKVREQIYIYIVCSNVVFITKGETKFNLQAETGGCKPKSRVLSNSNFLQLSKWFPFGPAQQLPCDFIFAISKTVKSRRRLWSNLSKKY